MIDASKLRRLHDAATAGDWMIDPRYRDAAIIAEADRRKPQGYCSDPKRYAEEFAHPIASLRGENATDWNLIVYLRNNVPSILAALEDRGRLEWIIAEFNRPDVDTEHTGKLLGRIIAGGIVDDEIYPDSRSAIDAARGKS